MERDYRAAARVFKALCDPKRLAILEELRGGEKCACVLQEPMELTQSGLSYHMKVLCESGLVESRQEGKWTHYQLSRTGRDYAVKLLLERGEAADACPAESADAVLGANDAAQLEALNQIARQKGYQ